MNGNDLFTALSGLDPKYIDEAAFELRADPEPKKQAKVVSIRKIMYIAVPSAAAILLILVVSFPAILRVSKSESAASAPAEAPAYEAAAEAADEAVAEAEPQAETAEAAGEAMADEEAINSETAAPETFDQQAKRSEEAEMAESAVMTATAVYDNGILTVETAEAVIWDMNSTYSILTADESGEKVLQEGILKDITITSDPLTLDISEFELGKGNYCLKIGEQMIDFTI